MGTRRDRAPIALVGLVVPVLLAAAAPDARAEASDVERIAGTYVYAGNAQERAAGQEL